MAKIKGKIIDPLSKGYINKDGLILGLDISTAAIGWSYFQDRRLLSYGVFLAPYKYKVAERLCMLHDQLNEALNTHPVDRVIIEEPIYTRDHRGTFSLGGATLMVEMIMFRRKIPLEKLNNKTWKKQFMYPDGNANAQKEDVAKKLMRDGVINVKGVIEYKKEGFECVDDNFDTNFIYYDSTDAIGMMLAWINMA